MSQQYDEQQTTDGSTQNTHPKADPDQSPSPANTAKPKLEAESLEPRILMSATWADVDTDGQDELVGSSGNDTLIGTDNAEEILGYEGDDTLVGGLGDDLLNGGGGNDIMSGGGGDDVFDLSTAKPGDSITIDGGNDNDTIDLSGYASSDVTFGDGTLQVQAAPGQSFDIQYTNIEQIQFSDTTATVLSGDHAENNVSGKPIYVDGATAFQIEVTGNGTVDFSYDAGTDTLSITDIDNTNAATTLTISELGGNSLVVDQVTLDRDLDQLVSNVDLGTVNVPSNRDVQQITVDGGTGTINHLQYTGGNVWGDAITVNANVSTLSAQEFGTDVTINGDVGTLVINDDITRNSTFTIDGNVDSVQLGDDIWNNADLRVTGNANSIVLGGEVRSGSTVVIGGNVASFSANQIDGDLTIDGDADSITANSISGMVTVQRAQGTFTLTDGAHVEAYNYSEATTVIYDGSANALTTDTPLPIISAGADTTVEAGSSVTLGADSVDSIAGEIAHFRLDGNANDAVSGAVGTVTGADGDEYGDSGVRFGAAYFDGIDDMMVVDDTPQLSGDYTTSVWIKPDATQKDWAGIYTAANEDGITNHWNLQFDNKADRNLVVYHDGNHSWNTGLDLDDLADGNWHQLVIRREGTTMEVYLDGTLVKAGNFKHDPKLNASHLNIGGDRTSTDDHKYAGQIDELRVFDRALAADDLSRLFNDTTGMPTTDGDGTPLTYTWVQKSGPTVTLDDPSAINPTFTAPTGVTNTDLVFELTVSNGTQTSVDTVTITVNTIDQAPSADAGADLWVNEGDAVTLAGSGTDPEGQTLTYQWRQTGGPTVTLNDANVASPSFSAPEVPIDTELTFELSVNDGTNTSIDTVTVTVTADGVMNLSGGDAQNAFDSDNVVPGVVYHVDGSDGHDTLNLSDYIQDQATFRDGKIIIDLGGGQSFTIQPSNIDSVQFSDRTLRFAIWDGDAANSDWSDATNWSNDRLPGPDDIVVFNGTSSDHATLDGGFSGTVAGIMIDANYNGNVTLDSDLTVTGDVSVADGLLDARDHQLTVQSDLSLSAGSLRLGASVTSVGGDVDLSGGSFDDGNGTLELSGSAAQTLNADGVRLHDVTINNSAGVTLTGSVKVDGDLTVSSGTLDATAATLRLEGNNTITAGGSTFGDVVLANSTVTIVGDMDVDGDLTIQNLYRLNGSDLTVAGNIITMDTSYSGSATIVLDGTGAQTISANGGAGELHDLRIDKSLGAVTVQDHLQLSGDLTLVNGSFDASGATITFQGDNNIDASEAVFSDVVLESSTIEITGELDVDGDLTINNLYRLNGGELKVAGNVTTVDTSYSGSATIVLDGAGAQTINANGGSGELHDLKIDKASGNVTVQDHLQLSGDLTLANGSFDASGALVTFQGDNSINASDAVFSNVVLESSTVNITGELDVDGDLEIKNLYRLNGGELKVAGDITTTDTSYSGSATIVLDGTNDQMIDANGGSGELHDLKIDKVSGNVTVQDSLQLSGDLTLANGSFDASGALITFQGDNNIDASDAVFSDVVLESSTIEITGELDVDGDLTINNLYRLNGGELKVAGKVTTTDTSYSGSATVVLDGTGDQVIDAQGGVGELHDLKIDKVSGSVTVQDHLHLSGDLTLANGSFDASGALITFQGNNNIDASNAVFSDVVLESSTINISGELDVDGDLTINNLYRLNGGELKVAGNITTTDTSYSGSGTVVLDGSGDQVIDANGGAGELHDLRIDKATGNVTVQDHLQLSGDLTVVNGLFDATGATVIFQGNNNVEAPGATFGDVVLANSTLNLTGDLIVEGDLTINNLYRFNHGTIWFSGDLISNDNNFSGSGIFQATDGSATISLSGAGHTLKFDRVTDGAVFLVTDVNMRDHVDLSNYSPGQIIEHASGAITVTQDDRSQFTIWFGEVGGEDSLDHVADGALAINVTEGESVALNLATALNTHALDEGGEVLVRGVPAEAVLSAGFKRADGVWVVSVSQVDELSLWVPKGMTDFDLSVELNLIRNGSFEGDEPLDDDDLQSDRPRPGLGIWNGHGPRRPDMSHWNTNHGGGSDEDYGRLASDGSRYFGMNIAGQSDNIAQAVNTEAGATYTLRLDLAALEGTDLGNTGVEIYFGGQKVGEISGADLTDPNAWQTFQFKIRGSGGAEQFEVREINANDDANGLIIDNIEMIPLDTALGGKITVNVQSASTAPEPFIPGDDHSDDTENNSGGNGADQGAGEEAENSEEHVVRGDDSTDSLVNEGPEPVTIQRPDPVTPDTPTVPEPTTDNSTPFTEVPNTYGSDELWDGDEQLAILDPSDAMAMVDESTDPDLDQEMVEHEEADEPEASSLLQLELPDDYESMQFDDVFHVISEGSISVGQPSGALTDTLAGVSTQNASDPSRSPDHLSINTPTSTDQDSGVPEEPVLAAATNGPVAEDDAGLNATEDEASIGHIQGKTGGFMAALWSMIRGRAGDQLASKSDSAHREGRDGGPSATRK